MKATETHKAQMRARNKRAREHNKAMKLGKPCVDCGMTCTIDNFMVFDWDHRDPNTKTIAVSQLRNINKMDIEIAKCDLRCKACHGKKTWLEQAWRNRRQPTNNIPSLFDTEAA